MVNFAPIQIFRLFSVCKWRSVLRTPILLSVLCLVGSVVDGCSSSNNVGEYRVIKKTDSDGKQVVVGVEEDARLFCKTNAPWKKCLWKPPRNGVRQLRCEFKRGPNNVITCPSFPEVHYDDEASKEGGPHHCAIVVQNIQEHHEGNWKCEFELDLPYQTEEPVIVRDRVRVMARGFRYP